MSARFGLAPAFRRSSRISKSVFSSELFIAYISADLFRESCRLISAPAFISIAATAVRFSLTANISGVISPRRCDLKLRSEPLPIRYSTV